MPASSIKVQIAKILKEEGYIENFKILDEEGAIAGSSSISDTAPAARRSSPASSG